MDTRALADPARETARPRGASPGVTPRIAAGLRGVRLLALVALAAIVILDSRDRVTGPGALWGDVAIAAAALATALLGILARERIHRFTLADLAVLGLVAAAAVSAAAHPGAASGRMLRWIGFGALLYGAASSLGDGRDARRVVAAVTGLTAFVVLRELFRFSWWNLLAGDWVLRMEATFLDPNLLACHLAMVLPACAGLALSSSVPLARAVLVAPLAVLAFALLPALSFGGFLGAGAAACFLAIPLARRHRVARTPLVAAAAIVLLAGGYFARHRIHDKLTGEEASASWRFDTWKAGLAIAAEHPLAGAGWGSFPVKYVGHGPIPDASVSRYTRRIHGQTVRTWKHAHNTVIHAAAELGVLAGLSFLLLLAWPLVLLGRILRAGRHPPTWLLGTLGSVVAFSFHGLVDAPWIFPHVLRSFFLFLGLAAGARAARGSITRDLNLDG